jgi:mannose-6-phosphate isomerase-like protein (cupin superfamily)
MSETSVFEKSNNRIDKIKPFVLSLQNDIGVHFEILNSSKSIGMRSGLVTLLPGQECGSHNTKDNEELLIILQGSGEVNLDRFGIEKIHKGCTIYIPPKTQHNVVNNEQQVLQYIYVVSKIGS